MPVKVAKKGDKFRIIEAATGAIAKNNSGTALDGGGHSSKLDASRQAAAINAHAKDK